MDGGNRFPRTCRLRRASEFRRVLDTGRKAVGRHLVLIAASGPGPHARLGIIASRKVGHAVLRNRAKRRFRELFRVRRLRLRPDQDLVLIARHGAPRCDWADLERDFDRALHRLDLVQSAAGGGHDPAA